MADPGSILSGTTYGLHMVSQARPEMTLTPGHYQVWPSNTEQSWSTELSLALPVTISFKGKIMKDYI